MYRCNLQVLPELEPVRAPHGAFSGPPGWWSQRGESRGRRKGLAPLGHWPLWVYRLMDAVTLVQRARSLLLAVSGLDLQQQQASAPPPSGADDDEAQPGTADGGGGGEAARRRSLVRDLYGPDDPTAFSYWLSGNLLLPREWRQRMLESWSTVQRLRLLISLLRSMGRMRCAECGAEICGQDQAFCMSKEGPVNAFVNPNGDVHETATFLHARNLSLYGRSSTEHSYFPGYKWTVAYW